MAWDSHVGELQGWLCDELWWSALSPPIHQPMWHTSCQVRPGQQLLGVGIPSPWNAGFILGCEMLPSHMSKVLTNGLVAAANCYPSVLWNGSGIRVRVQVTFFWLEVPCATCNLSNSYHR